MKKVQVQLIGGPFDGERVWVDEGDSVQYVRQVASPVGNDHAAIYAGNPKSGSLLFIDDQEIEYE